jgi:dUTP pyrophosphatase
MNFLSNNNTNIYAFNSFMNTFLHTTGHDRFMHLRIFIDSDSDELKNIYINSAVNHNQKIMSDPHFFDAGFDLFLPQNTSFISGHVNKIDFKVKCCAQIHHLSMNNDAAYRSYFSGFYVHPRSSLSKTPLRLANSTGIIDAGYRGNLIGMLDCNRAEDDDYTMGEFTRLLQICGPSLMPIYVEVVDHIEDLGPITTRGGGGIGSTGI